jgi:hypothetical protein
MTPLLRPPLSDPLPPSQQPKRRTRLVGVTSKDVPYRDEALHYATTRQHESPNVASSRREVSCKSRIRPDDNSTLSTKLCNEAVVDQPSPFPCSGGGAEWQLGERRWPGCALCHNTINRGCDQTGGDALILLRVALIHRDDSTVVRAMRTARHQPF